MRNHTLLMKRAGGRWAKAAKLALKKAVGAVAIALAIWGVAPTADGQTTFKPFQVRAEWPVGVSGTLLLTNNNLRVATNGASVLDGTGTNWIISPVTVSVGATAAGITAAVTDSSGNPVTTIPVNLNTGNSAMNTNLYVQLTFDGTQSSGTSSIGITFNGGVTNGYFVFALDVGKIWDGSPNAGANGAGTWSAGPWLGGALATGDTVVFTDTGAQTNHFITTATTTNYLTNVVVDVSTAISSLRFAVTNGTGTPKTNYQNLYINDGQNLAINGNNGFSILRDYTYWSLAPMIITIWGTNGTFIQTNESSTFSILSDGQANSMLDMSRLGNLYLDICRDSMRMSPW